MGSGALALNPAKVALFIPSNLKKFKLDLFNRIGRHIEKLGGRVLRHDPRLLEELPDEVVPIVGCMPECRYLIDAWMLGGRRFVYWDRGYCRRVFATWLPRGESGGYYRWHVGAFQMQRIKPVPDDRWKAMKTEVWPWAKGGRHILIAAPTATYSHFHRTELWTDETIDALSRVTDRPLMIRGKESKRPLAADLKDAHAIVCHASNAAVEAVIMGCPAFVDPESAASLVGDTVLSRIETPRYPDRQPWLNALAYCQFSERELVDGTLWKLLG